MRAARYDAAQSSAGIGGVALGAADWLCLGAAPTFAIMAILGAALGGQPEMLCSAMGGAMPVGGMALMYGLMSVFHLGPWLRLLSRPGPTVRP